MSVWIRVRRWLRGEQGGVLAEYGMLLALILVAAIGAIGAFGDQLVDLFEQLAESITI